MNHLRFWNHGSFCVTHLLWKMQSSMTQHMGSHLHTQGVHNSNDIIFAVWSAMEYIAWYLMGSNWTLTHIAPLSAMWVMTHDSYPVRYEEKLEAQFLPRNDTSVKSPLRPQTQSYQRPRPRCILNSVTNIWWMIVLLCKCSWSIKVKISF